MRFGSIFLCQNSHSVSIVRQCFITQIVNNTKVTATYTQVVKRKKKRLTRTHFGWYAYRISIAHMQIILYKKAIESAYSCCSYCVSILFLHRSVASILLFLFSVNFEILLCARHSAIATMRQIPIKIGNYNSVQHSDSLAKGHAIWNSRKHGK